MRIFHRSKHTCGYPSAIYYSPKVVFYYFRQRSIYYNFLNKRLQVRSFTGRIRAYLQKIGLFIIPFFEALRGEKLSYLQVQNLFLAGVLTPLFDDAIESNQVEGYLRIVNMLPVDYSDAMIILFSKAYRILREGVVNSESFHRQLQNIVDIETCDTNPYTKLTKGSAALLLYAICANLSFSSDEKDFIARTGAFFQLIDDIYDQKKDKDKNMKTFPVLWERQTGRLKTFLLFQKQRIIHHPVLKKLPTKNKKTIEGIIVLLYCLAIIRIKYCISGK